MFILSVVLLLFVGACSAKKVTDSITKEKIETLTEVSDGMKSIEYHLDTMDRGNLDYVNQTIVLTQKTTDKEIKRGTVIVENESGHEVVTRVIGLPNEKVKIKDGVIFINNKKLDSFYGEAHRAGLKKDEYFEAIKEVEDMEQENMEEIFSINMDEVELKEDEYFTIGDDWFRSEQKVVPFSSIEGIVHGILE